MYWKERVLEVKEVKLSICEDIITTGGSALEAAKQVRMLVETHGLFLHLQTEDFVQE